EVEVGEVGRGEGVGWRGYLLRGDGPAARDEAGARPGRGDRNPSAGQIRGGLEERGRGGPDPGESGNRGGPSPARTPGYRGQARHATPRTRAGLAGGFNRAAATRPRERASSFAPTSVRPTAPRRATRSS